MGGGAHGREVKNSWVVLPRLPDLGSAEGSGVWEPRVGIHDCKDHQNSAP